MKRCSGVLLPIFSLPSPYGIGTLGKAAYDWIDFLHEARQQLWQVLPIGPTSFGDSPYQSFSAFAGNPYFIDLEQLCEDGLLQKEDCAPLADQADSAAIDYAKQYQYRYAILKKAYSRFDNPNEISRFRKAHNWVDDYALFMALKDSYNGLAWTQWPSAIRKRERHALEKARQELQSEVDFYVFLQLLFYTQWKKLAAYARAHNVKIIGDIPIYVALDSADAWANPELFLLDEEDRPVLVAGCPPDAFTADGQLWGNPLYRWDLMQETGFQWWKERLSGSFELYDCLRIDHFRGFESYYAIPYGDKTARNGAWQKGPGKAFVDSIKEAFPDIPIIAEDLGYLTPEVRELLEYSGFPGMKILQFAFDAREKSDYIPFKYPKNCVVYTGTHDNDTILGWLHSAPPASVRYAKSYLLCETVADETCVDFFVSAALSCAADWAVIPIQDWLRLGHEARINTPSTLGGNWVWRLRPGNCTKALAKEMKRKTELYERNSVIEP